MISHVLSSVTLLALLQTAFGSERISGCEVVVIGAGIGGAYSAWRLAVDAKAVRPKKICILEAKQRAGGRILSVDDPVPGFEGFTVDLGAYRFHRSLHRQLRLLVDEALGIKTQCYTDPFDLDDGECGTEIRNIIATRGKTFGIKSDGTRADDAFAEYTSRIPYVIKKKFQWGGDRPLEKPRRPLDFLLGPTSIVKEIGERWDELLNEKDYPTAMRIADEIITKMKSGSYRGTPYSEVSLLQASVKEGLTPEEMLLYFDTAWDVGDNFLLRLSLETLGQLYLRYFALLSDPIDLKSMVTPVEKRRGTFRRIGMKTIVEEMLKRSEEAGARIFYGAKVTSVKRVRKGSRRLILTLADGRKVITRKVIANIGKPDLVSYGLESEPMKSSSMEFKRAVERNFVTGLAKTYCFWDDAWWLTKMTTRIGRTRIEGETAFSMRYHDGHFVCRNATALRGCRGGFLVSYQLGDNTGAGSAIFAHTHNQEPYTPLTNTDNIHRLIPGKMTVNERLYFDDLHKQIRRVHRSSLMEVNGEPIKIPQANGCVFGDWRDIGVHVAMGPGKGKTNIWKLYARPVEDLDISLVNEAWGQDQGWSEASLNSAERALFHVYGLEKPTWMDDAFHNSVIKRFNQARYTPYWWDPHLKLISKTSTELSSKYDPGNWSSWVVSNHAGPRGVHQKGRESRKFSTTAGRQLMLDNFKS